MVVRLAQSTSGQRSRFSCSVKRKFRENEVSLLYVGLVFTWIPLSWREGVAVGKSACWSSPKSPGTHRSRHRHLWGPQGFRLQKDGWTASFSSLLTLRYRSSDAHFLKICTRRKTYKTGDVEKKTIFWMRGYRKVWSILYQFLLSCAIVKNSQISVACGNKFTSRSSSCPQSHLGNAAF